MIIVEGNPKAPLSIATTPNCREGTTSFPELRHLTLDQYIIMLSVKQGGIKYHFSSFWYDSVSQAISEPSTRYTNLKIYVYGIKLPDNFWQKNIYRQAICFQIIYKKNDRKKDFASNNPQSFICH